MGKVSRTEAALQGLLREWEEKARICEFFLESIDPYTYIKRFFPDPFLGVFPEAQGPGVAIIRHEDLMGTLLFARTDFYASYQVYFKNFYSAKTLKEIRAVVVDLDYAKPEALTDFLGAVIWRLGVRPTAVVLSGHGLHVVYILDPPIQYLRRYKAVIDEIGRRVQLKFRVRKFGWKVDLHPYTQPYRVPGSMTKISTQARAYLVSKRGGVGYTTLKELADWVGVELKEDDYAAMVEGRRVGKRKRRRRRDTLPDNVEYIPNAHVNFYNKVFEKVLYEVRPGRRYLSLCALTVAAWKCQVSREELERDLRFLAEELTMKYPEAHPVREKEVDKALRLYNPRATRVRRVVLEKWLGVPLPPQIKRVGLPRKAHIKKMNAIRRVHAEGWAEQAKALRARGWSYSKIAEELGVSKMTAWRWVNKY